MTAAGGTYVVPQSADRRRARRKAAWRRRGTVALFMSPWIAGFTIFFGYPLVMSGYYSFTHYDLLSPPRWVGLANYRYLFTVDQTVWPAVRNTLWLIVFMVPLQVLFALGVAMLVARARRGVGLLPDGLLPAGARAAGGRDARLRVPAQSRHRPGQCRARPSRDPGAALVRLADVVEAVAHIARPLGHRQHA